MNKEKYLEALQNANENPEAYQLIEQLINKHFAMVDHMKETSLYDVFAYEERITNALTDATKIVAYENKNLKQEVNDLRKQLGLCKKYK